MRIKLTIHLISVCIRFEWTTFNYCLFCYLVALFLVWQWAIEKFSIKPNPFLAATISLLILIIPMMVSFILTIKFKEKPYYIFDWLVYAYALYGTLKMIFAIRKRVKWRKGESVRDNINSWISVISALYTLQMMEFRLIVFVAGDEPVSQSMYVMQLATQGLIFLFASFVLALFIIKFILSVQGKPTTLSLFKDGKRIITGHSEYLASGTRFVNLRVKKEERSTLEFNVTTNGGTLEMTILDRYGNQIAKLDNPANGQYIFPLTVGERYKILIRIRRHKGSYTIYL